MPSRRNFLKITAAAGGSLALDPVRALASRDQTSSGFFGAHPFIDNNPDAVFIMRTAVGSETDTGAKVKAGLDFARSVIIPRDSGVPLTSLIPVKPNIRTNPAWAAKTAGTATVADDFVGTDAWFVEGVIEGMKELGLSGSQFYIREVNGTNDTATKGYPEMAERTGSELRYMGQGIGVISENDLVWTDTPEGLWYRKIPHLWPINTPGSWLLNIAKMKTHGMGCTLSAKNLQGTISIPYQQHCANPTSTMDMNASHLNPTCFTDIKANFSRHKADGVPRWDKPGSDWNSGLGMETWASRNTDNNAALQARTGLHIIEAIFGRDGDFSRGPNPAGNDNDPNGDPWNYPMNYIIFGKRSYHVDIIGKWLAGHEPGNFGFFHLAKERGLATRINPQVIPVYEWKADGSATLTPLEDFTRTPLKTYYLQRNYSGQTEPFWHLCNEPYTYPSELPVGVEEVAEPRAFLLRQNHPNPFNPNTSIEYVLPKGGQVKLEVYNASGQLVEVLEEGYRGAGSHLAVWNTSHRASGTYFYRFRCGDFTQTRKMTLLK